jgi:hypothetical protein
MSDATPRRLGASDWRGHRRQRLPEAGWHISETMFRVEAAARPIDLITRERFGDFVLSFEWCIDQGGNSGVLYRVSEDQLHAWQSGPEMQLVDDVHHSDGADPLTACGAFYGVLAPTPRLSPAPNRFHSGRIVANGTHIQHWIDNQPVLSYDLESSMVRERIAASKFADFPDFARARRGHLVLQHHQSTAHFRNIEVETM